MRNETNRGRWMFPVCAAAAVSLAGFMRAALGDTVEVSALEVQNIEQGNGKPQVDKSADGNPITLSGEVHAHGLGLQSPSRVVIKLGGATHFSATVGVDDEVKGKDGGTAAFTVTADGTQVFPPVAQTGGRWRQGRRGGGRGRGGFAGPPPMHAGDAPQKIDLDVGGVRVLVLDVAPTNDGVVNDHADWADAMIEYKDVKPQIVPAPKDEAVVLTPVAPDSPRINGAKIFGVRPGHPFMFTVAATGVRPIQFSAEGLPAGLALDAATGFITGKVDIRGEFPVKLHAKTRWAAPIAR